MKFFMGLLSGIALTVLFFVGTAAYLRSPRGHVQRCMALYSPSFEYMSKDVQIQEMMRREGFDSIEEAVRNRCEYWVRNGQKF